MEDLLDLRINGQALPSEDGIVLEATGLQEWEPIELSLAPVPGAIDAHLTLGGVDLGPPSTTPFDPIWRWRSQPGGVAGLLQGELAVTLADGGSLRRRFALRLLPRSIDRQAYAELLRAIAREARALALRLGGQGLEGAALAPVDEPDRAALEEALALIQRHGRILAACLETLAARPGEALRSLVSKRRLDEPWAPARLDLRDLTRGPIELPDEGDAQSEVLAALREATGGPLPLKVTVAETIRSYDIPEHRFAAWLAGEVARRAKIIHMLAEAALEQQEEGTARSRLEEIGEQTERLARQIAALRSYPPLAGLPPRPQPPNSRLLRQDHRYRPLLQIWRELRAAPLLVLDLPLLQLPITDLPALYESWTALTVCAALVERGEVLAQQLCAPLEEGWTLRLQRDRPILKIRRGGRVLLLRYQPRYEPYAGLGSSFGSLDRYLRIPDLSIEVRGRGERWLAVLDAKYRLAPDDHPPQDALDDIYAYKGSLGQKGVPLVRYAALLYPGHGLGEDYGGIGALPHLPGHTNALQAALDRLLNGS